MKFNQNASFNVNIKLNGEVDREDAIEHLVNEIRKFLKSNVKDGHEIYISGRTDAIDEDDF